jgi:hypothetical protein
MEDSEHTAVCCSEAAGVIVENFTVSCLRYGPQTTPSPSKMLVMGQYRADANDTT